MWLHSVAEVSCYLMPCTVLPTIRGFGSTPSTLVYASLKQQKTVSIYPTMGGNRLLYARGKLDRGG